MQKETNKDPFEEAVADVYTLNLSIEAYKTAMQVVLRQVHQDRVQGVRVDQALAYVVTCLQEVAAGKAFYTRAEPLAAELLYMVKVLTKMDIEIPERPADDDDEPEGEDGYVSMDDDEDDEAEPASKVDAGEIP